jgi:hypothetical protein
MYAERVILETDKSGKVTGLPDLPPNSRVEAIFLVLPSGSGETHGIRRPHPDIAGKTTIVGDVISSAPGTDWDLPS